MNNIVVFEDNQKNYIFHEGQDSMRFSRSKELIVDIPLTEDANVQNVGYEDITRNVHRVMYNGEICKIVVENEMLDFLIQEANSLKLDNVRFKSDNVRFKSDIARLGTKCEVYEYFIKRLNSNFLIKFFIWLFRIKL